MAAIIINGKKVVLDDFVSDGEIRSAGAIRLERQLIRKSVQGYTLIPKGTKLALSEGDTFFDAPTRIKGSPSLNLGRLLGSGVMAALNKPMPLDAEADIESPLFKLLYRQSRDERIARERLLISQDFSNCGGISYDEKNCSWLIIPKYPLPLRWKDSHCKLLIIFPGAYPITPPVGFYLNRKFKLQDGSEDLHLQHPKVFFNPDLTVETWYWYCVRIDRHTNSGWKPSQDYTLPDNLMSFLAMVQDTLAKEL